MCATVCYLSSYRVVSGLSITQLWGRNFGPIPNAKNYVFFPIPDKKNPNFTKKTKKKKFFFFFFFGSPSLFHIIQILKIKLNCLITNNYTLYIKKRGKFIIGINLAMETSYIRTMSNFPILVKTLLIFPIPWAPAPFPKRGVRALRLPVITKEKLTKWRKTLFFSVYAVPIFVYQKQTYDDKCRFFTPVSKNT